MNYIVFDLEWNQPADGKSSAERELLFEILEIGAVKLDENFHIIGKFNELICPQVYHQINWHTQKMLNLKKDELKQGGNFKDVCAGFLEWCGPEEYIFCTWGPQDLTELQRNMHYFGMEDLSDRPIPFYNVQKLFGTIIGDEISAKSLETAVDMMGLKKDIPFHRAYSDAYYTAKVFSKMDETVIYHNYSYDLYHIPRCKKEEIRICSNTENTYISRGVAEKSEITESRYMMAINCMKCNQKAVRAKVRWFSSNGKNYYCAGYCKEHGYIKGRMRIRKSEQNEYYAEKVLSYTTEEEVLLIKEKKKSMKKNAAKKEQQN